MDDPPKGSPTDHAEALYTFTILDIENAPNNTSSFGLIQSLDAALAQSGADTAAPTFLEYDYSPTEFANRDNILRLLVRDATLEEDTDYYNMAQQLLSSDLLRDDECGLLSAFPSEDQAWLDWLGGSELLTILPSRKVPAAYLARLQCKKRKSSEFQPYFICPLRRLPYCWRSFCTKRDVLHHLLSDHNFDSDQLTFLNHIMVTDGHPNAEEEDKMGVESSTTQTCTPHASSRVHKTSRHSPPLHNALNTKPKLDMSVAQAASSVQSALSAASALSTPSASLAQASGLYAPPFPFGLTHSLPLPPWPLHTICITLPPTILSHCDTFPPDWLSTPPAPDLNNHPSTAEINNMQPCHHPEKH